MYLQLAADYGSQPDAELVARARQDKLNWIVETKGKKTTYQVIAPKSYTPEAPHGILVFVNAGETGQLPGQYQPLLGKHKLIAIGADESGNKHSVLLRHGYALAAVDLLRERYNIDDDRIYITGTSGGGRLTSQAMLINADVFTGAIPLIGCNAYMNLPAANGGFYPGFWKRPDPRMINQARRNGRFALMTGEKDMNRDGTRAVYEAYKKAGFEHITYLEEPGLGHHAPSAAWFEKAIVFLDEPLTAAAKGDFEQAQRYAATQPGRALPLYAKAAAHGAGQDFAAEALAKLAELSKRYDDDKAEAVKTIDEGRLPEAQKLLMAMRRQWGDHAADDVRELTQKLIDVRRQGP
jgi:predicted esterase